VQHTLDRHTIGRLLRARGVDAWGVAGNDPPLAASAPALPTAVSVLMRVEPAVVRALRNGPTAAYRDEYRRLNGALNETTAMLVGLLTAHGHRAMAITATSNGSSPDPGDAGTHVFPHKTAATQSGLGWIGKTALFVSSTFGPAVRLSTVFTDLALPAGQPQRDGQCGACRACVDACPAACGRDVRWRAGMPLSQLFDAARCRRQMADFGHVDEEICGICMAACPMSLPD
jgi:epoxyqueuosine reductase QueG